MQASRSNSGPGEKAQGFPVETATPNEGTGAEIGSMSIVKGARNLERSEEHTSELQSR